MADYMATVTAAAAANAAPVASFHTGASRAFITEVHAFANTAVAIQLAIGIPANTPVATTSKLGQAVARNVPASLENVDSAWSTAPTVPTNFFAQTQISGTIGTGFIWVFQPTVPLEVAPTSWITLWNNGGSTGPVVLVNFKWTI